MLVKSGKVIIVIGNTINMTVKDTWNTLTSVYIPLENRDCMNCKHGGKTFHCEFMRTCSAPHRTFDGNYTGENMWELEKVKK